ncbi:hypothetical protein [Yoonia sediminilitoris]|uniref:Uncharacterized protein n=1 Tax=Yoonia sediminilitoris TaxID=1286148 RepID=A0A2T6KRP9_9RHOB|nr:hypothetical protein [Yoonia sediminilitoris]PUB19238.1 hypothetical protein C8N45_101833 [Yoonia sediminilitoris]RCW99406.1 hypothetical protein DFP92_101833 [Yoonia sediminilitoris]
MMASALGVAMILPGGIAWPVWTWAAIAGLAAGLSVCVIISWRDTPMGRFLQLVLGLTRQRRLLLLSGAIAGLLVFSLYACARATGTVLPPPTHG